MFQQRGDVAASHRYMFANHSQLLYAMFMFSWYAFYSFVAQFSRVISSLLCVIFIHHVNSWQCPPVVIMCCGFLASDLMRGVISPYGNTGWTSSEGATRNNTDVIAWLIYRLLLKGDRYKSGLEARLILEFVPHHTTPENRFVLSIHLLARLF